jgi:hypothetical protein
MRLRALALAVLAAAAVSTGALAATTAKDPTTLILRKADFPASANYDSNDNDDRGLDNALDARGLDVEAASYLGITYSRAKGALHASGAVWTPSSVAEAKKVFAIVKKARGTFFRQIGTMKQTVVVRPSYGNQQFARYDPAGSEGIASVELLVRRNSVVWLLNVSIERRPNIPKKAEVLAQVRKYATKQKRRVGAG